MSRYVTAITKRTMSAVPDQNPSPSRCPAMCPMAEKPTVTKRTTPLTTPPGVR